MSNLFGDFVIVFKGWAVYFHRSSVSISLIGLKSCLEYILGLSQRAFRICKTVCGERFKNDANLIDNVTRYLPIFGFHLEKIN